ncbi:MAG: YkgJ family cysteine cluster protein [Candidatus Nanoarchaeia archaeon]|nr:YkgJ family cysteine cluster protein [Candidatus Nanoarchaeia archaeon]
MINKCLNCREEFHCCINGFTFVGINDAKKIKKFINKDYDFFLDFSKLPKQTLKLLKNDDPSLEGTLRYSLLKDDKILRIKKRDGKCIFLKDRKCEIYEVRPKICRIYPYWCIKLINGKIMVIEHDSEPTCEICNLDDITKDEEVKIKKLFNDILKEAKHYNVNINNFVKNNLIN